jgi:Na+-transporting NADH:ubiquinone oxidoreductase subunit NqrC
MKKAIWFTLIGLVLVSTVAVVAQQQEQRQQGFARNREIQQQAMTALQEDLAKMKASQEEAAKAMQGGGQNFQNMSEEERTKMREEFTKRREATQAILTDMEAQIAKLKGRRQLQTAFDEGQTELKAIRDLANEEKATKAAERLGQLIDKNQTKFDDMMKKLGLPEGRMGGGQGGQRPAGQ